MHKEQYHGVFKMLGLVLSPPVFVVPVASAAAASALLLLVVEFDIIAGNSDWESRHDG